MSLSIHVHDGVHSQPANGVLVTVSPDPGHQHAKSFTGRAGEDGVFVCPELVLVQPAAVTYQITIGVEGYFATFGMSSPQREFTLLLRVPDAARDCHVRSLITPSAQMTHYHF